jgi:hypothetical protein
VFLFLWMLWLLVRGTLINAAGGGRTTAMVKAQITEARLNSLLNNGGSFGGDTYVVGDHHVSGKHYTARQYIGGYELTIQRGTPSSPGSVPGSYNTTWANSVNGSLGDIILGLRNANIFQ